MKRRIFLLTASEAAHVAEVSADSIRHWARTGVLPVAAESARGVRMFRREDVLSASASRQQRRTTVKP
jgi:DNA-binding transcriptional MerR regulator